MTEPRNAVFISHATQDAEATSRIVAALRAAGIEVWYDKSELRGDPRFKAMLHKLNLAQ